MDSCGPIWQLPARRSVRRNPSLSAIVPGMSASDTVTVIRANSTILHYIWRVCPPRRSVHRNPSLSAIVPPMPASDTVAADPREQRRPEL